MKRLITIIVMLIGMACVLTGAIGCQSEGYVDEKEVELQFSVDTLSFDTVFTTVSTPVRQVKVYNRTGRDVRLSTVGLAEGSKSRFRLNVDGDTSRVARNIEIMAGDSIFIFIQANIKPNDSHEPFVIEDAIVFGNGQRLPITAWGRNAVYHRHLPGHWVHVIDCDEWDHSLPHVILDTAAVDSAFTLHLQPGEEIYFYNNALLLIYRDGTLDARGTAEEPIIFSSLRHDGWYDYLPGQWVGIWFSAGSKNNVLEHVVVENGTYGLLVDTNVNERPTLELRDVVVRSMSYYGLFAQGAKVKASNMLVYQCGVASVVARCGGSYHFTDCTFANYWHYGARTMPGVVLQNWYMAEGERVIPRDLREATFERCIIYGSYSPSEVLLDAVEGAEFNTSFEGSLVKGGVWDEDPLFVDPSTDDYHLQDESPAIGIGYQYDNQ